MRALLEEPRRLPTGLYRCFVRRCQVRGLLLDQHVGGEPYLGLNAVVLAPGDLARLAHLTCVFTAALHRAGRALRGDVAALIELGFPWVAAELLAVETPRRPIVGRFDFARDVDGRWWVLEFNADTPSGFREAIVAQAEARRLAPGGGQLADPNTGLAGALADAFERALATGDAAAAGPASLGLVTRTVFLEDVAQTTFLARLLGPRLAARGIGVAVGDLANLAPRRGGLTLLGRPIGALYRNVSLESMLGRPQFAAVVDAARRGRLALLNGLYGLLLQNKALLAWLWAHRDDGDLPADERAAIRESLPPTWSIGETPADLDRAGLVVKQVFGREGEEVYLGDAIDDARWELLRRQRTHVAQRRVAVQPLIAALPASHGPERRVVTATVGSFSVEGAWAGLYTRLGDTVVTANAKWVATLVEPEGGP